MSRTCTTVLIGLLAASMGMGACSSTESTRSPTEGAVSPPEVDVADRPEPTEETGPPTDAVTETVRTALQTDGDLSYDALLKRLGVPRATETEPVPNQYVEGQVDTLRTLDYTGLEALVYDVTDDTRSFLVRLTLSSTQYASPEGLRVGLAEEQVIERVGPPTRRDAADGTLVYEESGSTPTSMIVRVREGRVVQIDWEFYFS